MQTMSSDFSAPWSGDLDASYCQIWKFPLLEVSRKIDPTLGQQANGWRVEDWKACWREKAIGNTLCVAIKKSWLSPQQKTAWDKRPARPWYDTGIAGLWEFLIPLHWSTSNIKVGTDPTVKGYVMDLGVEIKCSRHLPWQGPNLR